MGGESKARESLSMSVFKLRTRLPYMLACVAVMTVTMHHTSQPVPSDSIFLTQDGGAKAIADQMASDDDKWKVTKDWGWDTELNTAEGIRAEQLDMIRSTGLAVRLAKSVKEEYLHNYTTPQGKAYYWLVHEDKRKLADNAEGVEQRFALATLFFALNGPDWQHGRLHWLVSLHECQWHKQFYSGKLGIKACNSDRQVTEINLARNRLSGTIPPEIGLLKGLKVLSLGKNRISGALPDTMGNLENMEEIYLNNNDIEDNIPETFTGMSRLRILHLGLNHMQGTVPDQVCGMMREDAWSLMDLRTDCDRDFEDIVCECCTFCCDALSTCYPTEKAMKKKN